MERLANWLYEWQVNGITYSDYDADPEFAAWAKEALKAAGPTVVVKELAIDREKAIKAAADALRKLMDDPYFQDSDVVPIVDAVIECVEPVDNSWLVRAANASAELAKRLHDTEQERDEWKETARSAQGVVDEWKDAAYQWKIRAEAAEADVVAAKDVIAIDEDRLAVLRQNGKDAVLVIQKLREALRSIEQFAWLPPSPMGHDHAGYRARDEALEQADEFLAGQDEK